MALRDTWFDVYATAQLGPALRSALGLWLALAALGAGLLLPLLVLLLKRALAANGGPDLDAGVLTALANPRDLALPGAMALILLLLWQVALTGLLHIAAGASRAATPRALDALATGFSALPRLTLVTAWQAAAGGLLLLIAAGGLALMFGDRLAHLSGGALALGALPLALYLLAGHALALPCALYGGQRGRGAPAQARALLAGRRWRALRLLATNLLLAVAITAGLFWLTDGLLDRIIGATPPGSALVARTIVALLLMGLLLLVTGLLFTAGYAVTAMHLYLEFQGLDGLPQRAWAGVARRVRVKGAGAAALLWLPPLLVLGAAVMVGRAWTNDLGLAREVLVVAHRGSLGAPENTLSGLYQALADGADLALVNVQETADGAVVLLHDEDLRRVAGLVVRVWEVNLADLRRADVDRRVAARYVNEPVTTLEEALMVAEGRLPLAIELMDYGHGQRLADAVTERLLASGCATRCLILARDPAALGRVRELAPQVRLGLIVTDPIDGASGLDAQLAGLAPELLSLEAGLLTRKLVRDTHAAGRALHARVVDDPVGMARLVDWGVDGIVTNRPAPLRHLLDARAAMSDRERLLLTLGRALRR